MFHPFKAVRIKIARGVLAKIFEKSFCFAVNRPLPLSGRGIFLVY